MRGWKEKTTRSEWLPIRAPSKVEPMAHAASSTTAMPRSSQSSWMAATLAGTPPWCTSRTARVAGVRHRSMVSTVTFWVEASTSAKTGVAPT